MSSVKQRIDMIKQPNGGYVKPSQFTVQKLESENNLNESENIPPGIVGMAVEYLTRYSMGTKLEESFLIPCSGAYRAQKKYHRENSFIVAVGFLSQIKGLDDKSIINACKLVTYDVWYRNPTAAMKSKGAENINPDEKTIQNIRELIERSLRFWDEYGPITKTGFNFEPDGYTKTVDAGDGDFLTKDTLWDFKVLKSKPTNKHTLQLLMYWIMGQHSGQEIFKEIKTIGIFNPRLNMVYRLDVDSIPKQVIEEIEDVVICY